MVEDYVKSQMKDPSSFQLIKTQVVDTTMMSKFLSDRYSEDTAKLAQTILENYIDFLKKQDTSNMVNYIKLLDKKTEIYRDAAKNDSIEIAKHSPDRIFYISYMVDYRAKNSFGALDKASALVNFYPTDTTFKMITP